MAAPITSATEEWLVQRGKDRSWTSVKVLGHHHDPFLSQTAFPKPFLQQDLGGSQPSKLWDFFFPSKCRTLTQILTDFN